MELRRETVKIAYIELGERHGWPVGATTDENKSRIIDIDFIDLSEMFTEETFPKAFGIARKQARKFPVVADFYIGFDAPRKEVSRETAGHMKGMV